MTRTILLLFMGTLLLAGNPLTASAIETDVAAERLQLAQADRKGKPRRIPRQRVIIEDRAGLPIPQIPRANIQGNTYSDRVVGCTHGAGMAGLSGAERGLAIHNCAFGH
jgi:hypothetical protein